MYVKHTDMAGNEAAVFIGEDEPATAQPFNAAKIPDGYQLVPIERDHNMRCSAIAAYNVNWSSRKSLGEVLDALWAAQLKDAPEPPMAEAVGIEELEHENRLLRARNERLEKELAEAVAAEREACAKLCDEADKSTHPSDLADAIRARCQGQAARPS